MNEDHYAVNRAYWDEHAPAHVGSADYAVQEIIADPTRLSDVIRFDLPRLGDVNGLRGIHLQCTSGPTMLVEHDSVPWEALPVRMRREGAEWRLIDHPEQLPLSYTLQAVKR